MPNTIEADLGDGLGSMHSDLTKVRQTMFNLLSNAAKFTKEGKITVTASRDAKAQADLITLAVADTGVGMTADQIKKIFQPFSQADASTTREFGGTGLGLAISQHYCTMLGGDISVASEAGVGTTFTVTLPANAELPDMSAGAAAEIEEEAAPETTGDAARILIVDDDSAARDLVSRHLGREGYKVETASDGAEAIAKAKMFTPDVITLDVLMPGMDGWAVLERIKADAQLTDIPVIMLSITDDKRLGFSLGASDFLTKPVAQGDLRAAISRLLRGPGNLLVVDDDRATRDVVRRVLERDGWSVFEAANGRRGLEMVGEADPAIILLDLMMPEMDGFEFLSEIRRSDRWRDIPVIIVTAKVLNDEDRRRLEGNVEGILHKEDQPMDALLAELSRMLRDRSRVPGPNARGQ